MTRSHILLIVVLAASMRGRSGPSPSQVKDNRYTKNTVGPRVPEASLLPKCEVVHTPVHLSGLDLRGLRVEDGHSNPADSGMLDPMKSPLHGDGIG